MNKKNLIYLLLLLNLSVFGQTEITVEIDSFKQGGVAKLIGVFGDQNYMSDTAIIDKNGKSVFKNKNGYKTGLFYFLLPNNQSLQLIIDKEKSFSLKTSTKNLIGDMKVTNSVNNELLYKSLKFQSTYFEPKMQAISAKLSKTQTGTPDWLKLKSEQNKLVAEKDDLIKELRTKYPNQFYSKFKIAGQNPRITEPLKSDGTIDTGLQLYIFKSEFWNEMDFSDENMMNTPVYYNKLNKYIKEMTPQSPDSVLKYAYMIIDKSKANKELFKFTLNWIALQYQPTKTTVMDGEAIYAPLLEKYFTKELAVWSDSTELSNLQKSAKQMKPSYLGKIGQNIWGTDVNGKRKELYDLKAKVKVLFIYNPDCEHCQEQTPELRKIYDVYKSRGVEIFSLASQAETDKWKAFGPKYGVNWTDVVDPNFESNYHMKYYIDITPEMYVLNDKNIIVAKNLKANQLAQILDRELGR
jgi:peroxiredoxin